MKLEQIDKKTYKVLEGGLTLGKAFMYEFEEARILKNRRMNYFIELEMDTPSLEVVDLLIHEARKRRSDHGMDARIYHCALSESQEAIAFYQSVPGFALDEKMLRLTYDHSHEFVLAGQDYDLVEDNLRDMSAVTTFSEAHQAVFVRQHYTYDKLEELREKVDLKSYGLYDKGKIIGNVLTLVDQGRGIIEDIFVDEAYRGKGLADHLMKLALNDLTNRGIESTDLEVWSANDKATSLYFKLGFKVSKTSELSIGMAI